jgi:tape measure domain-containing protein|nr:MAG TPA: tail tape measure protein [Caudoviricetes sp.]
MANILEYTLSLNDRISGKLTKIGIANDKQLATWAKVQQRVKGADATMQKCGVSLGSLRERVAALRAEKEWIPASNINAIRRTNIEVKQLEGQIRRLERVNGGAIKTMLSDAFNSIPFANVLTNPIVVAGTAGFKALQQGFAREQVKVAFDVLIGDENASGKLLADIKQFGMATPYMTADLQESAKMMLSFGITADKIMPNLKALGDIAMGDRNKMNSLTLAFSQMTSTGKLAGQDLLQMINAGFNPLTEMSRTSGKSVAVLKDEMSKGKITADMVTKAFYSATQAGGQFYGMTEKMGQSKAGKWSTLVGKGTDLLLKLYDIIEPLVIPAMNSLDNIIAIAGAGLTALGKIINWVVSGFNWWFSCLNEGNTPITLITILLGSLTVAMSLFALKAKVVALWSGIVTAAKWAWAAAQNALNLSLLACPVTWIVAGVIALIGTIAYLCYKIDGWGSLWNGVVGFMKYTFMAFVEGVKLYFSTLINGIMIGLDKIKLGWYKFKEACGIGDSAENQAAIAKINADVEKRQQAIVDGAKKVAENASKAKESLSGISMSWNSDKSLGNVVGGLKDKFGIGAPAVPGMTPMGGTGKQGGTNTGAAGSGAASAIATGGSRSTSITINLKSLVENLVFEGGYESSRDEMQRDLESALIRVLQTANSAL